MLDVVFLAMFLVVPLLGFSIYLVRYRRAYTLHKWLQVGMGLVLLVAVAAFEIDVRFFTEWEALAVGSPYYVEGTWDPVWISLTIHLFFAVPTPLLWIYVIVAAWIKFPNPPTPGKHSARHVYWGRVAAIMMTLTAMTGWIFYYLAFVATAASSS